MTAPEEPRLSVTLIARDEEDRLPGALASVAFADERIVVVDAASTDRTEEVARQEGARVVVRPFDGFGRQKNAAASLATNRWILSIDADEIVSPSRCATAPSSRTHSILSHARVGQSWRPVRQPANTRTSSLALTTATRVASTFSSVVDGRNGARMTRPAADSRMPIGATCTRPVLERDVTIVSQIIRRPGRQRAPAARGA